MGGGEEERDVASSQLFFSDCGNVELGSGVRLSCSVCACERVTGRNVVGGCRLGGKRPRAPL